VTMDKYELYMRVLQDIDMTSRIKLQDVLCELRQMASDERAISIEQVQFDAEHEAGQRNLSRWIWGGGEA
jgi:hypothetical protein